jgi:transcriptional regulator with XRE-family HTH domain
MEFREYLQAKREDRHFSLRQLGALAGVSGSYLSLVESGQRGIPSPDILRKLAGPLQVPYEELLAAAGYLESPQSSKTPEPAHLPDWLSKLPPEMREFVKEEAKHGWPYLRLARGLKMQDLTEEELRAIIDTWMDAKKRYEREFGPRGGGGPGGKEPEGMV